MPWNGWKRGMNDAETADWDGKTGEYECLPFLSLFLSFSFSYHFPLM